MNNKIQLIIIFYSMILIISSFGTIGMGSSNDNNLYVDDDNAEGPRDDSEENPYRR
jgi:hypothetical protein